MWDPQRLTTLWASTACCGDSFTFTVWLILYYDILFRHIYLIIAPCKFKVILNYYLVVTDLVVYANSK
jgi:hypothetical protein